ncbi:MAG: ArsR family transcriptional regulator, arsenate/arsenite/antimonite-responsive transcriptional [Candidatus Methanomethylophilaceae archaeon]|nr:ArsR family transcriptional regulator, arsenate/arsenite/antimonite-responsive transcriptional [Candidatus Methanomethylophilaceae archaeon]
MQIQIGWIMENMIEVLKALSNETRLRMINLLKDREICVCDIVDTLGITQTKASRHLKHLKSVGLVEDRQQAQWVYYSIAHGIDERLLDELIARVRITEPYMSDLIRLEERKNRCGKEC